LSGAETALQGAILVALAADGEVADRLGDPLRVVGAGSPRPAFPCLEIARHRSESAGAAESETSVHTVDLVVLSRDAAGVDARATLAAVRRALSDAELGMTGWRCVLLVPVFADHVRESEAVWRSLLRVRVIVEAT
jgi:hypothetical protein